MSKVVLNRTEVMMIHDQIVREQIKLDVLRQRLVQENTVSGKICIQYLNEADTLMAYARKALKSAEGVMI